MSSTLPVFVFYFTVPFQQRNQVCIFNSVFSNCIIVYVLYILCFCPRAPERSVPRKSAGAHISSQLTPAHIQSCIFHTSTASHLHIFTSQILTSEHIQTHVALSFFPPFLPSLLPPFLSLPFLSFPFPSLSCPVLKFPFLSFQFLSFPFLSFFLFFCAFPL